MKTRSIRSAALAAAMTALSATSAFAWGFGPIHFDPPSIPFIPSIPSIPQISIPSLPPIPGVPMPNFPGISVPGLGNIRNLGQIPGVSQAMQNVSAVLGRSPPAGPNPAQYAPQAGAKVADALWGSQQIKGMCMMSGAQCGAVITQLTAQTMQDAQFRQSICGIMPKIGNNIAGFSAGFNGHMLENIRTTVPSSGPVTMQFAC